MKTAELDTPVLTVDADALDRNIARMKDMTETAGISYRPHAKTHKSATVARKQIDAGAIGVCCAKLGEAEVLASEGIDNILITTPVVGESKISRLLAARNQARIAVVADNAVKHRLLPYQRAAYEIDACALLQELSMADKMTIALKSKALLAFNCLDAGEHSPTRCRLTSHR